MLRSARATRLGLIGSVSGVSLHAIPESTSEEGIGSRLPWLPSESQANSDGGAPSDSIASSIIRRISASPTTEITWLIWAGARSARWSVMTVERQPPGRLAQFLFRPRFGDGAAEDERGLRLGGHQVDPRDHPEHLGPRRDDGHMPDVVVEHRQHHLRPGLLRPDCHDRCGHHLADRCVNRYSTDYHA